MLLYAKDEWRNRPQPKSKEKGERDDDFWVFVDFSDDHMSDTDSSDEEMSDEEEDMEEWSDVDEDLCPHCKPHTDNFYGGSKVIGPFGRQSRRNFSPTAGVPYHGLAYRVVLRVCCVLLCQWDYEAEIGTHSI